MSRLAINSVANTSGRIAAAILNIVAVPIYLRVLGSESYGLIAFVTALQGMLAFLDFGLATTANREVARSSPADTATREAAIVTLETLYWLSAAALFLVLAVLAFPLANSWLTFDRLSQSDVRLAMILAAATAAFRWPVAVYNGILSGLEKQVLANIYTASVGLGRVTVGISTILWVHSSVQALLIANLAVAVGEVIVLRLIARRALGLRHAASWRIDRNVVNRVGRFALGAGGVGALGTLLANVDKVLLGRAVSLQELGIYSTITTIAAVIPMLGNAVCSAAFPRLARASAEECARTSMSRELKDAVRLIFLITFPCLLFLASFGKEILILILSSTSYSKGQSLLLILTACGGFLNALASPFYATLLASGRTGRLLLIHVGLAIVLLPYYALFLPRCGVTGAACGWLMHNAILLTTCYIGCRQFLGDAVGAHRRFLMTNITIAAVFALTSWGASWVQQHFVRLLIGILVAGITICYVGREHFTSKADYSQ